MGSVNHTQNKLYAGFYTGIANQHGADKIFQNTVSGIITDGFSPEITISQGHDKPQQPAHR